MKAAERVEWHHGRVFAVSSDSKFVVTSPNMDFIPHPVVGSVRVSLMADSHFGCSDPIHWPQFQRPDTKYLWLSVLRRKPQQHDDRHHRMWRVLRRQDFETLPSSELGVASSLLLDALRPICDEAIAFAAQFEKTYGPNPTLESLVNNMRQAFSRLDFPATFRDVLRQHACFQRFWLYTLAWLDWHVCYMRSNPLPGISHHALPPQRLMGCITTSPVIAQQLFEAQIPVWLMRAVSMFTARDVVEHLVVVTPPEALMEFSSPEERDACAAELAGQATCQLFVGNKLIEWINRQALQYADLDVLPVSLDRTPSFVSPALAGPSSADAGSSSTRPDAIPTATSSCRQQLTVSGARSQKNVRQKPCKLSSPSLFFHF